MGIIKRERTPNPPFRRAELDPRGIVHIKFDYNPDIVQIVRSFPNRRWNSEKKEWTCSLDIFTLDILEKWNFLFDENLLEWKEKISKNEKISIDEIPGLRAELKPFQKEGFSRILQFRDRAILADDMGLGKTVQAIAWLQYHKESRPAVVVCPASLKEMWARYIQKWMTGETAIILEGRPQNRPFQADFPKYKAKGKPNPHGSIYIVNYDIYGNKIETRPSRNPGGKKKRVEILGTGWVDHLEKKDVKIIVFDESHYLKNPKSQRSVGGMKSIKSVPKALALTGTPIINRPVEFWPVLSTLIPHVFNDYFRFGKRYCGAYHDGWGWNFTGASNKEELHQVLVNTCMVRRLKSEVLSQLPPKQRAVIPLPMSPKRVKEYRDKERALAELVDDNQIIVLAAMTALKKAAAMAKMDAACEWIEDFLESGEKLVVFAHHHDVVDILKERISPLTTIAEITGRTIGSKQAQQDLFQNDPACRLFIGSRSAVEGITLTAASNVAFVELYDTPGIMAQAEDRIHRIGQEAENITAWYLVAKDTIEEDIAEMVDRKLSVIRKIVDGVDVEEEEMIMELLRKSLKRQKGR